jgi:hypothetical protein
MMIFNALSGRGMPTLPVLFFAAFAVFLAGCQAEITGTVNASGRAALTVNTALQTKMAALIRKLSTTGGTPANAPVIDAAALTKSFQKTPGIESASFANKNANAVDGTLVITKIDDFVAGSESKTGTKFITWQQNAAGGSVLIHLDRENGPAVIAAISQDLGNYLGALAAPVATGEESSRQEYLDLVRMMYDANIAQEIAMSDIKISLRFPALPTSIKGGVINGERAEFTIPLTDILVLEKPLDYEVRWGQ